MIGFVANLFARTALPEEFHRAAAWASLAAVVVPLLVFVAWPMFKSSIIENARNEANAEFAENLAEATGEADTASEGRKKQIAENIMKTEELVDAAIKKGCAVPEYLNSGGAKCVRDNEGPETGL